jgi:hypothetical protein
MVAELRSALMRQPEPRPGTIGEFLRINLVGPLGRREQENEKEVPDTHHSDEEGI